MSFGGTGRTVGGYGEFAEGGLGNYNNFSANDDAMGEDKPAPQPLSAGVARNGNRSGMGGFGGGGMSSAALQQELHWLKQDNHQIKGAVILLEKDRDNLRHAIRKLKVENSRIKLKMKRMAEAIKAGGGAADSMDSAATEVSDLLNDLDYDDIGRDFILVGGPQDPFSLRFEATIRDAAGIEHKSAERYYWYKMAETFGDTETMAKILAAPNTIKAEEAMKEIKGFDETTWNLLKMQVWEEGQQLKMDQVRWIQNLLVYTDKTYIAVASQDKVFGTGWRKNREEANKSQFWDGENGGGKALMRMRDQFRTSHAWAGPYEEQETEKKHTELKRDVWRRFDSNKQSGFRGGARGGARGGMGRAAGPYGGRGRRGGGLGYGGRGSYPSRRNF
uniref:NADAR domain-containing protein n=1 Tax=Plectus sambesii TaxID=2011161 RepID=A0A914WXR5_9BILA